MKRTFFAIIALLLAGGSLYAKELKRVEEQRARTLFVEYLKGIDKAPEEYAFNLKPFGKTTWLIDCYTKGREPSLPWRHVMNSGGRIKELTMDSMNVVFLNEYPSSPEEKDRKKLIDDFTKLHSGERVNIIAKTSDIPGYDKAWILTREFCVYLVA